jgi:DNA-binding response OmpR family regulator
MLVIQEPVAMDHLTQHDWVIMSGRKILVVDDSRDITSLIEDILCVEGAQVITAHAGRDAMVLLGDEQFDVLLLDLTMPKPDGWDVLEFIGKTAPHMLTRTVVLTGMCYDRNIARTLQDKGITHLFKPFQIDSLCKIVCGLLSGVELPLSV